LTILLDNSKIVRFETNLSEEIVLFETKRNFQA